MTKMAVRQRLFGGYEKYDPNPVAAITAHSDRCYKKFPYEKYK